MFQGEAGRPGQSGSDGMRGNQGVPVGPNVLFQVFINKHCREE